MKNNKDRIKELEDEVDRLKERLNEKIDILEDPYYDLLKHSENTYNNRNNFFLVFHSITLAAITAFLTSNTLDEQFEYLSLCVSGMSLLFAVGWLISNLKSYKRIREIQVEVRYSWSWYHKLIEKSNGKLQINKITGRYLPMILLLFWLVVILFLLSGLW